MLYVVVKERKAFIFRSLSFLCFSPHPPSLHVSVVSSHSSASCYVCMHPCASLQMCKCKKNRQNVFMRWLHFLFCCSVQYYCNMCYMFFIIMMQMGMCNWLTYVLLFLLSVFLLQTLWNLRQISHRDSKVHPFLDRSTLCLCLYRWIYTFL